MQFSLCKRKRQEEIFNALYFLGGSSSILHAPWGFYLNFSCRGEGSIVPHFAAEFPVPYGSDLDQALACWHFSVESARAHTMMFVQSLSSHYGNHVDDALFSIKFVWYCLFDFLKINLNQQDESLASWVVRDQLFVSCDSLCGKIPWTLGLPPQKKRFNMLKISSSSSLLFKRLVTEWLRRNPAMWFNDYLQSLGLLNFQTSKSKYHYSWQITSKQRVCNIMLISLAINEQRK